MDIQRNIFLAKKYMVDSIYRSANIEGIVMTFSETQTICDGNKRTATLFANHFMIQNGLGVLSIPVEKKRIFTMFSQIIMQLKI